MRYNIQSIDAVWAVHWSAMMARMDARSSSYLADLVVPCDGCEGSLNLVTAAFRERLMPKGTLPALCRV